MLARYPARRFLPLLIPTYPPQGSGPAPPGPPRAGLAAWYKADALVTLSGSDVVGWGDSSGNGNDIAPAITPPTFVASSIGGKPGITFGASTLLTRATSPLVSGGDRTVLFVSKPTTNPAGIYNIGGPVVGFRALATGWFGYVTSIAGTVYGYSGDIVNDSLTSPPTILDVPNVMEVSSIVGSPPIFVFNGTTYAPNPGSGVTVDSGTDGFIVGATDLGAAATQYFAGDICEILIYDHVLAGAELTQARAYLDTKYAITPPPPGPPLTGLAAWYDANEGVTVSAGNVVAWADQSGNGFDLTPPGGLDEPTLHTGIVNGLPGVLFDTPNGNAQLNNPFTGGIASNAPRYVMAILKPTVPTVGPQPAGFGWGGPFATINASAGLFYPVLGDYSTSLYVTGQDNFTPDPTTADTAYAYEWVSTGYPGDFLPYLDGAAIGPGGYTSSADGGAQLIIGSDNGQGNFSFSGYICELLIYDHVVTGSDLTDLRNYLNTKYGL